MGCIIMILWLKMLWIWTKCYREDNTLFCFLLDKMDFFYFLLKLSLKWDTNKCRPNSVCKPLCDQLCKWIMVFKWNIFATSLWEEKVHCLPMFQFLPPSLHHMGQITCLVELEVDFRNHCSVKAFIAQPQAWVDIEFNFWWWLESVMQIYL